MSWSLKNSSGIASFSAFDRTHVNAACIDSCITWPICPVMVKPPLPFILLASMKRMSPPAGVHARTLGALSNFRVDADLDSAQKFLNGFPRHNEFVGVAFGNTSRLLAANRAEIALQGAHAGLASVR